MPKRFHIITMGCQMNVYDSEQMERLLAAAQYEPASGVDEADLVLVNTCAIREKPEHKVYSLLGRLTRMKRKRPGLVIGVGGCVAQQEGRRLVERNPGVDFVFGTGALPRLADLLKRAVTGRSPVVDVGAAETPEPPCLCPLPARGTRASAFVTIMTGCDNFCTYCVVPYVRGREASRRPEAIMEEIEHLVRSGVREVTLLGQNVNAYGATNGHRCDFPGLLGAVHDVKGLERLRFTTSHPKDLSDALIDCFGRLNKLAPHVHLPVQSGSDRVLKRMNRGYGREYYLAKASRLRKVCPGIGITSDIIVGFPGETEEDFQQTLDLVESVRFDNVFAFKYSDRQRAPASRLTGKVAETTKDDRFAQLLERQTRITLDKHVAMVGTTQPVLVEGPSKKDSDRWTGRTPCNKVVNFPNPGAEVGELLSLEIVKAHAHSLQGCARETAK